MPSESGSMGGPRGRDPGPRPRLRSAPLDDLDLVRHAGDAVHARDVVEREVALDLEVDVALERDPAVLDVDVEVVARELGVPAQPLQGRAADLRVLAAVAVQDAHVELVVHVDDAARAPRVGGRGALLREAADRSPEGHRLAVGLDGDLVGGGEARVALKLGAHVVDDPVVGEIHCVLLVRRPRWKRINARARAAGVARTRDRLGAMPRDGEDLFAPPAIAASYGFAPYRRGDGARPDVVSGGTACGVRCGPWTRHPLRPRRPA